MMLARAKSREQLSNLIQEQSAVSEVGTAAKPQLRCARGQRSAQVLLINDKSAAATTGAISEQKVLEAMGRAPRREFDETIRGQRNATTSGSVIGHELDAVGELLVGVTQLDDLNGFRGAAVSQGGFEPPPGVRVDAHGEHLGMEEPALPVVLPSNLDSPHHNRAREARAVETFPKHFAGCARGQHPRESRAGTSPGRS